MYILYIILTVFIHYLYFFKYIGGRTIVSINGNQKKVVNNNSDDDDNNNNNNNNYRKMSNTFSVIAFIA